MKQSVIFLCYKLLFCYHAIRSYLMRHRIVCVFVCFLQECYHTLYHTFYQIREEPNEPQWTSVSFVVRKPLHSQLVYDEAYALVQPHSEDVDKNSDENAGADKQNGIPYPIFLSPYPVVSDVLLSYKHNNNQYFYRTIPTYWSFLKEAPTVDQDAMNNLVPSEVEILGVEYNTSNNNNTNYTLDIDIPEHDRMVGNTILSMAYVARYLNYTYGTKYPIDIAFYTITVMILKNGTDIETVCLTPTQALVLYKDSFDIVSTI